MKTRLPHSAPALTFIFWLLLMTLVPFLIIAVMSVLERSPQGSVIVHLNFSNYSRAFSWVYMRVLGKTFTLAAAATVSCLILGFPVAYYLARAAGANKQFGLILIFIPIWSNFILRV
jgi:spermidine/putrescine transport system permease protein